eukprot:COSAG06_NODE_17880_length_916_cov_1.157895_2_plen_75_part_01
MHSRFGVLSLCWSRACLGKLSIFSIELLQARRFLTRRKRKQRIYLRQVLHRREGRLRPPPLPLTLLLLLLLLLLL